MAECHIAAHLWTIQGTLEADRRFEFGLLGQIVRIVALQHVALNPIYYEPQLFLRQGLVIANPREALYGAPLRHRVMRCERTEREAGWVRRSRGVNRPIHAYEAAASRRIKRTDDYLRLRLSPSKSRFPKFIERLRRNRISGLLKMLHAPQGWRATALGYQMVWERRLGRNRS